MSPTYVFRALGGLIFGLVGLFLLMMTGMEGVALCHGHSMNYRSLGPGAVTFGIGFVGTVSFLYLGVHFIRSAVLGLKSESPSSVENRLDELERLKHRELITREEYAAKRQEILNDL